MSNAEKILDVLQQLYEIEKFSLGLHTTDKVSAELICKTGLKTGVRSLEGTVKLKGDLSQVSEKDLNYFFPYTTTTVAIAIPQMFDAPRIMDNKGGYEPLCEFSSFFNKAQHHLSAYRSNSIEGLLPNYYILGFYNKDFEFVVNPECFLYDEKAKAKMLEDIKFVQAQKVLF